MTVELYQPERIEISKELINRWCKIPVAVTVDLNENIRQVDPLIRPLNVSGEQKLFGQVVTARCEPPDFGAVLHSLDVLASGDVLLIAAGGHADHAMIGDILSGHLRAKGIVGVVCDGAVRDVATLQTFDDFPVYARSINPKGPTGAERGAINAIVTIASVDIQPGDFIMGDADGLVVLSAGELADYIDAAEARLVLEEEWQQGLAQGKTVPEIFGLEVPIIK